MWGIIRIENDSKDRVEERDEDRAGHGGRRREEFIKRKKKPENSDTKTRTIKKNLT